MVVEEASSVDLFSFRTFSIGSILRFPEVVARIGCVSRVKLLPSSSEHCFEFRN